MKGFIIEGITGSGKTSLLNLVHLKIHKYYPSSTKMFISEHYTNRIFESIPEEAFVDDTQSVNHSNKMLDHLSFLYDLKKQSKFSDMTGNPSIFVTVERFLLSQILKVNEKGSLKNSDHSIHSIYARIKDVRLRNVILILPEKQIRDFVISTLEHRNDNWRKYLESIGSVDDIMNHYIKKQKALLQYVDIYREVINPLVVKIEDRNWQIYADYIFSKVIQK